MRERKWGVVDQVGQGKVEAEACLGDVCRICQARVTGMNVMGMWRERCELCPFAVIAAGLVPPTSDDLKVAKPVTVDLSGLALAP